MKIDSSKLRSMILREIAQQVGGKQRLREAAWTPVPRELEGDVNALVEAAWDSWRMQYDEGDPSMAELGEEAWEYQCEMAANELRSSLATLLGDVSERLMNGEFYEG